jgi:hypothetical protein
MDKKALRAKKNRSTKRLRSLDICLLPRGKKSDYLDNRYRSGFSKQKTSPTKRSINSIEK